MLAACSRLPVNDPVAIRASSVKVRARYSTIQRWKWVSGSVGHGSWVTASDPLTHDDEITAQ